MDDVGLAGLFERYRREGNLDALAQVFDRTAGELLKVARHLARDEAQAEDLVQATFLAAIEHAERFDVFRELVPWLVGILTNKAQAARSIASRATDSGRLAERASEDPARDTEILEFMATLERALERVPEAYRQVLRIHLAEGKGAEEIAHEVKRPAGTVRVQLHRGLKHLRRLLPAGFALGGVVVLTAPRGLAAMRAEVLGRASALAKAGVAAGAGVSTVQLVGGVLLGKKIALAVGFLVVASVAWWVARRDTLDIESAPIVGGSESARLEGSSPAEPKLADIGPTPREAAGSQAAVTPDDPYGSLEMEWVWADGTPAAGLGVVLASMGEESPYDSDLFGFTDPNGRIEFDHLLEGKTMIQTDRGGSSQQLETAVVRGRRTSERFVVPPGIDVHGRVVDKDGSPVARADVWLAGSTLESGAIAATTETDGTYLVRSVHSSRCLFATADRFGSSRVAQIRELDPQSTGEVDLELRLLGECGGIQGIVLDPDGKPISGAWVTVRCSRSAKNGPWGDWPVVWMATLPDGTFRFTGLHKGAAEVEVFVPRFAVRVEPTLIGEDQTARVDVRLEKGFKVEGVVRAPDGSPVAGAHVHHGPSPGEEGYVWRNQMYVNTNSEGRYHLDFVPSGQTRLRAEVRSAGSSLSRAKTEITGRPGDHLTWDPILSESGKILGRLVDEAGLPIEGWSVEAQARVRLEYSPRSTRTDAQGRFEILDCSDASFRVVASPPRDGSRFMPQPGAVAEGVRSGKAELVLTVTSKGRPSVRLRGRVVDAQGNAVGGAQMRFRNEDTNASSGAITEVEDGAFKVGPMPAGTYTIDVKPKDLQSVMLDPIELAPDEERDLGAISIPTPGRVELVVRRSDDTTVEVPNMLMFRGRYAARLETTDGLTFRADGLQPGTYKFFPRGRNISTEERTVEIRSGEITHLELRIPAGVPQDFKFNAPPGEEGPQLLRLVVRNKDGAELIHAEAFAAWNPDGTVALAFMAGFARGRYSIEAFSKDGWEGRASFVIENLDPLRPTVDVKLVRRS